MAQFRSNKRLAISFEQFCYLVIPMFHVAFFIYAMRGPALEVHVVTLLFSKPSLLAKAMMEPKLVSKEIILSHRLKYSHFGQRRL